MAPTNELRLTDDANLQTLPLRSRGAPTTLRSTAIVLELLLGLSALGGGAALMLGPAGEIIPLPLALLRHTPFDSYFVPGLILFSILGVGPSVAAGFALSRSRWAPWMTVGVGVALLVWLAVEIALIGYSNNPPLQPLYLALGAALTAVGLVWRRRAADSA